jgi:NitT/TauT family transport system permease protein
VSILEILYALALSWLRLAIGLAISVVISFFVGILAGINKTAEKIIIPIVDILQSIPILGFFPVAVYFFIYFVPSLGPELAAIFLIITSELWNLIFAVYESVRSIPAYIMEQAELSNLNIFQKISKIYIPSSWSQVIGNFPISWAIGLFFLSSSEIISLGTTTYQLLGIGSLIFNLFSMNDINDLLLSFVFLILAIIATHVLFFRPLNEWAKKFKYELKAEETYRTPWFISTFVRTTRPIRSFARRIIVPRIPISPFVKKQNLEPTYTLTTEEINENYAKQKVLIPIKKLLKFVLYFLLLTIVAYFVYLIYYPISQALNLLLQTPVLINLLLATGYSALRILISVALMMPVLFLGIFVALNKLAKRVLLPIILIVASIPAPLFIPLLIFVFGPQIDAISILVIISGSIWYIFYNVFSAIESMPADIKEVMSLSNLSPLQRFSKFYFPALLPALITGSITAVGGAWNALMVAEWIQVGDNVYSVNGLGAVIDEAASVGNLNLLYAALIIMVLVVVLLDRTIWKKLYDYTTSKFRYEI